MVMTMTMSAYAACPQLSLVNRARSTAVTGLETRPSPRIRCQVGYAGYGGGSRRLVAPPAMTFRRNRGLSRPADHSQRRGDVRPGWMRRSTTTRGLCSRRRRALPFGYVTDRSPVACTAEQTKPARSEATKAPRAWRKVAVCLGLLVSPVHIRRRSAASNIRHMCCARLSMPVMPL
jgi:hypothetical protein